MNSSKCINTSPDIENADCVLRSTLILIPTSERISFLVAFIVVSVISLIGNIAVLRTIRKRKFKFIQKTCIVCLSFSDIFSTVVIAANNIETLIKPEIIWTLGTFLCSFIPMCQMAGIIFSSVALLFIAIDRYRNVVTALSQRWDPDVFKCGVGCVIVGLFGFGLAYPMYNFFSMEDITIVDVTNVSWTEENARMCISFMKDEMKVYYISMMIIIFLPLTVMFIWLYLKIAELVWKHRKPPSAQNRSSELESSSTQTRTTDNTVNGGSVGRKIIKPRDIRMERKVRTFKIVITLTFVFILCRLPYFGVFLLKLWIIPTRPVPWLWTLNYFSIILHVFNCALNPLLYTFLNQTIQFLHKTKQAIKTFLWEICCFCLSKSEFDDLDKQNPFVVEAKKSSRVQFEEIRPNKECY